MNDDTLLQENNSLKDKCKAFEEYQVTMEALKVETEKKLQSFAEIKNENSHFVSRIKGLEKMISEQKEHIDDLRTLADTKTEIKAKSLMEDFSKEQTGSNNEAFINQLQSQTSNQRDDIIQLKEKILELREKDVKQTQPFGQASDLSEGQSEEDSPMKSVTKFLEDELKLKEDVIEELTDQIRKKDESIEILTNQIAENRKKAQNLLINKDQELDRIKTQR